MAVGCHAITSGLTDVEMLWQILCQRIMRLLASEAVDAGTSNIGCLHPTLDINTCI
jgi:hypothetical protein